MWPVFFRLASVTTASDKVTKSLFLSYTVGGAPIMTTMSHDRHTEVTWQSHDSHIVVMQQACISHMTVTCWSHDNAAWQPIENFHSCTLLTSGSFAIKSLPSSKVTSLWFHLWRQKKRSNTCTYSHCAVQHSACYQWTVPLPFMDWAPPPQHTHPYVDAPMGPPERLPASCGSQICGLQSGSKEGGESYVCTKCMHVRTVCTLYSINVCTLDHWWIRID